MLLTQWTKRSGATWGLGIALIIGAAAGSCPGQLIPSHADTERPGDALVQDANRTLGLRSSEIVNLTLDGTPGAVVLALVPIDGQLLPLHLAPVSVRADGYQLLAQVEDGRLVPVEPGPERTLRGTLLGIPGTTAAGSMLEEGLHAVIRFADGGSIWIEPLAGRVAGAAAGAHVVYHAEDVIQEEAVCGTNDMLVAQETLDAGAAPGGVAGTGLCTTQLACDADYEYYLDWGSMPAVESRINSIINAVNVQYERDVDITHVITTIIVRTAEPDPYSSTDAVTLLNQFRNHWNANHGSIVRDVAQLFTGKEINGGTIGIAWLNAVCTSYGYSMVQSDFNGAYACATDLSAHELGHNWGADHCSCTSYTMNPFITCANVFHPSFSIPEIISFRDSRTCIVCGPGTPTGACCFDDGTCSVLSASDCSAQSGDYQGDGTDCSPNPCPQPMGACCFDDGTCSDETAGDCAGLGGTYEGDGTNCATFSCPPPPATGACCFDDGTCSDETAGDCAGLGGIYEGDGTNCATFSCPPPATGACCLDDGSCVDVTASGCASQGGAYEGDGTACASTNCPQPPGPGDVPLAGFNVLQGTNVLGGLADLVISDNSRLEITAAAAGNKRRTETIVTAADSTLTTVSRLDVTVESMVSTNKVKTTIYLKRWTNNKWVRLGSFTQSQLDTEAVFANVSNPNLFVNGSGEIQVRIFTHKKSSSAYTFGIDHVEVTVTP